MRVATRAMLGEGEMASMASMMPAAVKMLLTTIGDDDDLVHLAGSRLAL